MADIPDSTPQGANPSSSPLPYELEADPSGTALFRSDSVLPSSDRWMRWGGVVLFSSVGLIVGLMGLTQVNVKVRAIAQVRPSEAAYVIHAQTSGVVAELHAQVNQSVDAGETLAEIAPFSADSQAPSVTRHALIAETEGVVTQLDVLRGQRVQPGMAIARIMPASNDMTVRAQIPSQDIAQVEIGQPVSMRVEAYPYPDYGVLSGHVVAIAPDVTPCNHSRCPAAEVYNVHIQPDQPYLERQGDRYPLQPGMNITADIIAERERLFTLALREIRLNTGL